MILRSLFFVETPDFIGFPLCAGLRADRVWVGLAARLVSPQRGTRSRYPDESAASRGQCRVGTSGGVVELLHRAAGLHGSLPWSVSYCCCPLHDQPDTRIPQMVNAVWGICFLLLTRDVRVHWILPLTLLAARCHSASTFGQSLRLVPD